MIDTGEPYGISPDLLSAYLAAEGSLSAALTAIAVAHENTEVLGLIPLAEAGTLTLGTWGLGNIAEV